MYICQNITKLTMNPYYINIKYTVLFDKKWFDYVRKQCIFLCYFLSRLCLLSVGFTTSPV